MADINYVEPIRNDPGLRQRKRNAGVIEVHGPNGEKRVLDLDELNEADAQLVGQFGYNPVFKREFGYFSTFSFAVSVSGLFSTVMTTFSYPLYAGGSAAAVWCWLISGMGCMCIAVCLLTVPYLRLLLFKCLTCCSYLLQN
jgi:hypothetical protein